MKNLDAKLNTSLQEVRKIKMTKEEKSRLLHNILNDSPLPGQAVRSPYVIFSFVFKLYKNRLAFYSTLTLALVVVSGGLVFASGSSLPGNILYPLKTNVVEKTHSALIFSPEARAKYASELATERLIEAENLANKDELDSREEEQISNLIEDHTEALNEAMSEYRESKSSDKNIDDDIVDSFQAKMNEHAEALDNIGEHKNNESDHGSNPGASISKTARESAGKVKHKEDK